jgi:hypothetical protein
VRPGFIGGASLGLCEESTCASLSVNLPQTRRWIHHSEGGGSVARGKGMAAMYPVHESVLPLTFVEPRTWNRLVDQTNQTSPLNQLPATCRKIHISTCFSLVAHSNKSCAFVGGGDAACFSFAHPPIPMARNNIVDGITKGAWNHDAKVKYWPETR